MDNRYGKGPMRDLVRQAHTGPNRGQQEFSQTLGKLAKSEVINKKQAPGDIIGNKKSPGEVASKGAGFKTEVASGGNSHTHPGSSRTDKKSVIYA